MVGYTSEVCNNAHCPCKTRWSLLKEEKKISKGKQYNDCVGGHEDSLIYLSIVMKIENVSHSVISNFFCHSMDCRPPDSSVHGILQARVLAWVAISFSRGSSWPKAWAQVFHTAGRFFTIWLTWGGLTYSFKMRKIAVLWKFYEIN